MVPFGGMDDDGVEDLLSLTTGTILHLLEKLSTNILGR